MPVAWYLHGSAMPLRVDTHGSAMAELWHLTLMHLLGCVMDPFRRITPPAEDLRDDLVHGQQGLGRWL